MTIEKMQKRENEIWQHLQNVCEEETQAMIAELIELNLSLEEQSNL